MSTNLTPNASNNQPGITPEIHEALRTLRAGEHRLEREGFAFDWEERLELAAELADVLALLPEELADETGRVILTLDDEAENFEGWETRCAASARLRRVVRALEGSDSLILSDHPNALRDFVQEVAF